MDAMSHLGVAKDVCAYLTVHDHQNHFVQYPYKDDFKKRYQRAGIWYNYTKIPKPAQRYSGVYIENVTIKESPIG